MADTWTNDAAFLDDVGDVADLAAGLIGTEKGEAGKCSMQARRLLYRWHVTGRQGKEEEKTELTKESSLKVKD